MPSQETIERFIARVESNRHDLAIEEFYTEDATLQENQEALRRGRANHVAREKVILGSVKSVRSECVRPVFVSGDRVVIRWKFRFDFPDGTYMEIEELAYQRWEGEKIAEEQFFYDPAQRQRVSRFAHPDPM